MTTTIAPSVGAGVDFVQQGIGASPGYAAIDIRRAAYLGLQQGCIGSSSTGAYTVSQRGLGANMSVDIAANAGSLLVAGTSISNQGFYAVPPHSGVINETIATADATNPRIDQVIVETFDNAIDSSGNNLARTRVLTGTPTSGATFVNRNGAASLPANAYRLADIFVAAAVSSITNTNISDRRPKTRGHSNIATSESRTNTAYGLLPTPDQVNEIVLPTDGLIAVAYLALWQQSVNGAASADLFLNGVQLQSAVNPGASSYSSSPATINTTTNSNFVLGSHWGGLQSAQGAGTGISAGGFASIPTTGVALGSPYNNTLQEFWAGGPCYIAAAAGTYSITVAFKASSGSVTASNRRLWVWTVAPDQAVLA